jgi:hypothetical protein
MVAAGPSSQRGVGVAYNQVAKGSRDRHSCAKGCNICWQDNVLKAFRRSSCKVKQLCLAVMPAVKAWHMGRAPPGTTTPSCRGARLWPKSLQGAKAHSPSRLYQTSPIAMGQVPPPGLEMERRVDCTRAGTWSTLEADMSLSTVISATWLAKNTAVTCSYVELLSPAARLQGTLSKTLAKTPAMIWAGQSSAAGGCGVSVWVQGMKNIKYPICDCG